MRRSPKRARRTQERSLKQEHVEDYLSKQPGRRVEIASLSAALHADTASVRRHIRILEQRQLVLRGRGWVEYVSPARRVLEQLCSSTYADRLVRAWPEHRAIARAVTALVRERAEQDQGEPSLFLDVGTTCFAIADVIAETDTRVRIWTPNLPAALRLLQDGRDHRQVYVIGGEAESQSLGTKGREWETRYDLAVISVLQVTPSELWLQTQDYLLQKRRAMGLSKGNRSGSAERVVVVAGAHRLAPQSKGGGQRLTTLDEMKGFCDSGVRLSVDLVVGHPENEEGRGVLGQLSANLAASGLSDAIRVVEVSEDA